MTNSVFDEGRLLYQTWPADEAGQASTISAQRIARAIRSRGWLVAVTALACLALGLTFKLTAKPLYVSTAQLIVDPRELQGVNNGASPKTDNADATEAVVGNEMGVLKSNILLSALVAKDHLVDDPEFSPPPSFLSGLRASVDEILGLRGTTPSVESRRVAVLGKLESLIAVQRKERSFEIDVSVRTQDPDKSARLANDLVALYIAQTRSTASSLNGQLGTALQDRLSDLQIRARQADQRVEQFRIANHLVSAEGVLTSDLRLKSLTDQLAVAQTREDEDRAKVDQVDRARDVSALGAAPEAVQSQVVAQLRSQLAEALRRRSALAMQLGRRHPDLVSADEQVQTLQRLLDQELRRLAEATKNQYHRSLRNARSIRDDVNTLSEATLNNSSAVAQLRQLEQEAEAARTLFTAFLSRSRELSEQTQIYTSNVRQIGMALPALSSAGLPTSLIGAVSLGIGLILGSLLALGLDARDRRWRGVAPGSAPRAA